MAREVSPTARYTHAFMGAIHARARQLGLALCLCLLTAAVRAEGVASAGDRSATGDVNELSDERPLLLLVETETQDIDPVVGRFVNARVAALAEDLGYRVAAPKHTREAMVRLGITYPPTMVDLWTMMHAEGASRALLVSVWSAGGRYALRVAVGSADGSGPYYAEGQGDRALVLEALARAVAEALPAPGQVFEGADPETTLEREAQEGTQYYDTAGPRPPPSPRHRPLRLVLHGDTSFGFSRDDFRNHSVGGRLDYRIDPELAIGAFVGYANLKGRDGRASSLVAYMQLEDRVPLTRSGSVQVPLRVSLGYLAKNGPLLRLAAGVGFTLGERVDVAIDLLTPTFWLTPQSLLFSLDLGLELGVRL